MAMRFCAQLLSRFRWLLLWLVGFSLSCGLGAEPTYTEWRAACAKLPPNRTLGGRLPPKELLPLASFGELDANLQQFYAVATNGPMSATANWVGIGPKRETFFDVSKGWFLPPEIPFEPFAQKLVLPAGSRVILQGDLHGDVRSLLAVIDRWNDQKWLEGFRIVDPALHVIFLGDYTDRGLYGIEVLYTLMRLKNANPTRVHLGRGNHEDVSLVSRYGFLAEGRAKYGRTFNPVRILRAYDFLPVVIYLGNGTDFVQLCHGGMEPGYSPQSLLSAGGTNRFQLLGALGQESFLKAHPDWLKTDGGSLADSKRAFRDFIPTAPTTPSTIGFMWNDFTVYGDEPGFAINPDRAFVYGRPAVEFLLKQASGGPQKVRAVIRAHQHSGLANPMMRRLVASRGIFRHWQESTSKGMDGATVVELGGKLETGASRALVEGSVWTLNVTPDSVYGEGNDFRFATFGVLEPSASFADWRIRVETVEVPNLIR